MEKRNVALIKGLKVLFYIILIYIITFLVLLLFDVFVPFCPEVVSYGPGPKMYCQSFLWNSITSSIIELTSIIICLYLVLKYKLNKIWGFLFTAIPVIDFIAVLKKLTENAFDMTGVETVTTIYANSEREVYVIDALFLLLLLLTFVSWFIISYIISKHKRD